jgi:23S rRNA pseudouridine1911/1915/1917 synthase
MAEVDEIEEDGGDIENREELYEHYSFTVDPGQESIRVDKYLAARIENVSRSRLQDAADQGYVEVNGNKVVANYKIKPRDVIKIFLPRPKVEYSMEPEQIALDIIFEDPHLIVVNKPAGLVVHPGHGNWDGTLVNALLYHFKDLAKGTEEFRPGLVHRIDKNTSGLLVVAKDDFALNGLAKQFREHTVKRQYLALVWGDVKDDTGTITGHIGRHTNTRQLYDVYPDGDQGKHAITHYSVVERMGYVTLVQCVLETGRTHQIRVHMKYIGHPLFNDDYYGGDKIVKGTIYARYKQFVDNCFTICPRHALHAQTLGFIHPITKAEMFFNSPVPPDMAGLIDKWRNYIKNLKDANG